MRVCKVEKSGINKLFKMESASQKILDNIQKHYIRQSWMQ